MSGTARSPRYACETCRDSGRVFSRNDPSNLAHESFVKCPACDGKSRLAGEIDEPAQETPTLDALRNLRHGGPA